MSSTFTRKTNRSEQRDASNRAERKRHFLTQIVFMAILCSVIWPVFGRSGLAEKTAHSNSPKQAGKCQEGTEAGNITEYSDGLHGYIGFCLAT